MRLASALASWLRGAPALRPRVDPPFLRARHRSERQDPVTGSGCPLAWRRLRRGPDRPAEGGRGHFFGDAIVYGFPCRFDFYPTLNQVSGLKPDDACFVGGTSLLEVRGRAVAYAGCAGRFSTLVTGSCRTAGTQRRATSRAVRVGTNNLRDEQYTPISVEISRGKFSTSNI